MTEEQKTETFGKATVGAFTNERKELNVMDYIQAQFKDHRLITISELEDHSFTICVENPESTGKATMQAIRLSEESFYAIYASLAIYFKCKGIDLEEVGKRSIENSEIKYAISPNLEHFNVTP